MNIEMPAHVFAIEKRVRVPPTPPLFLLYLVKVTKIDGDSYKDTDETFSFTLWLRDIWSLLRMSLLCSQCKSLEFIKEE